MNGKIPSTDPTLICYEGIDAMSQAQKLPPTVYLTPKDFVEWIAPTLKRNPALRARILREILKQPHAMISVLLNPDWDSCDHRGLPQRFTLEEVRSLPKMLHAELLSLGRLNEGGEYSDRSVWRTALLKAAL